MVMQNVTDISGTVAATFIGTPIDASLLTLATDGSQIKHKEFLTGLKVTQAVERTESLMSASSVHEVHRMPLPLFPVAETSETNASFFDKRSVASGFTAHTEEEQEAKRRVLLAAPFMRDPDRKSVV